MNTNNILIKGNHVTFNNRTFLVCDFDSNSQKVWIMDSSFSSRPFPLNELQGLRLATENEIDNFVMGGYRYECTARAKEEML